MTPEHRAKKIVAMCGRIPETLIPCTLDFIAAEIHTAVEEEQELRADWNYRIECLEKQLAEAEARGRKEGLMEASNIVQDEIDQVRWPSVDRALERISARAKEVGQ